MKDYEIFLSPLAEFKLDKLLKYFELNWGTGSRDRFLNKLEKKVEQLPKFPKSCPKSRIQKDIRKSVVTARTSLYYRIHNKTIEIITDIDNRQNPEKIANEIKNYFQADS